MVDKVVSITPICNLDEEPKIGTLDQTLVAMGVGAEVTHFLHFTGPQYPKDKNGNHTVRLLNGFTEMELNPILESCGFQLVQ